MSYAVYIWQQKEWPHFKWDNSQIATPLAEVRLIQGRLIGTMRMLGLDLQKHSSLNTISDEIVRSSEIEGEVLNNDTIRSSVARHLGIDIEGCPCSDRHIEGIVQMAIDAMSNYKEALTSERLWNWHAALFPTGRSGIYPITVANWRQGDEPMQVVSGAMGKEKVHYQAPDASDVPQMMNEFIEWINQDQQIDEVIKAGIAHLWFVSIHPFDDGNGRITRVITDMLLARSDGMSYRFYSMSAQIQKIRNSYYQALETAQHKGSDITPWLIWFLSCLRNALLDAENITLTIIAKASFWERNREVSMNERQTKIINMLWDGFEGKLNTSKWAKIAKCSSDTALRDIQYLIDKGILKKSEQSGRSTSYELIQ